MYPFPQSVTPAMRTHMDAQTAFVNEMSASLFRSFQQVCELNMQLAQTMLEETTLASGHALSVGRQSELLGAASARAQPATEKLRAWQQHIARLAADAQVELARVTEQHVQNTTRTARAVVDEVARNSAEEAERGIRSQQEALRTMSDPFARADGAIHARADGAVQAGQGAGEQLAQGAAQAAQASLHGHQAGTTH